MTRAIMIATAIAAGWSFGEAQALTPTAIDATGPTEQEPAQASPYSISPPLAFEPPQADEGSFRPRLFSRGPKLQCVPFVRRESGLQIFGDAARWWAQARARLFSTTEAPSDGAVMVMRGYRNPDRGHVAVVREIVHDRLILVDHANWLNHGEISRGVPVRDVSPRGDWSQIKVWHVPGGHWGGRTYNVQGFILPRRTQMQQVSTDIPLNEPPSLDASPIQLPSQLEARDGAPILLGELEASLRRSLESGNPDEQRALPLVLGRSPLSSVPLVGQERIARADATRQGRTGFYRGSSGCLRRPRGFQPLPDDETRFLRFAKPIIIGRRDGIGVTRRRWGIPRQGLRRQGGRARARPAGSVSSPS